MHVDINRITFYLLVFTLLAACSSTDPAKGPGNSSVMVLSNGPASSSANSVDAVSSAYIDPPMASFPEQMSFLFSNATVSYQWEMQCGYGQPDYDSACDSTLNYFAARRMTEEFVRGATNYRLARDKSIAVSAGTDGTENVPFITAYYDQIRDLGIACKELIGNRVQICIEALEAAVRSHNSSAVSSDADGLIAALSSQPNQNPTLQLTSMNQRRADLISSISQQPFSVELDTSEYISFERRFYKPYATLKVTVGKDGLYTLSRINPGREPFYPVNDVVYNDYFIDRFVKLHNEKVAEERSRRNNAFRDEMEKFVTPGQNQYIAPDCKNFSRHLANNGFDASAFRMLQRKLQKYQSGLSVISVKCESRSAAVIRYSDGAIFRGATQFGNPYYGIVRSKDFDYVGRFHNRPKRRFTFKQGKLERKQAGVIVNRQIGRFDEWTGMLEAGTYEEVDKFIRNGYFFDEKNCMPPGYLSSGVEVTASGEYSELQNNDHQKFYQKTFDSANQTHTWYIEHGTYDPSPGFCMQATSNPAWEATLQEGGANGSASLQLTYYSMDNKFEPTVYDFHQQFLENYLGGASRLSGTISVGNRSTEIPIQSVPNVVNLVIRTAQASNDALLFKQPDIHKYTADKKSHLQENRINLSRDFKVSKNIEFSDGEIKYAELDTPPYWKGPLNAEGQPHGRGQIAKYETYIYDYYDGLPFRAERPINGQWEPAEYVNGKRVSSNSLDWAYEEAKRNNDTTSRELDRMWAEETHREIAEEEAAKRAKKQDMINRERARQAAQNQRLAEKSAQAQRNWQSFEEKSNIPSFNETLNNNLNTSAERARAAQTRDYERAKKRLEQQQNEQFNQQHASQRSEAQQRKQEQRGPYSQEQPAPLRGSSEQQARQDPNHNYLGSSSTNRFYKNGEEVPISECASVTEVRRGKFALGTGLEGPHKHMRDMRVYVINSCDNPIQVGACFAMSNGSSKKDSRKVSPGKTRYLTAIVASDRRKGADGKDETYNGREAVSHELFVWDSVRPAGYQNCE